MPLRGGHVLVLRCIRRLASGRCLAAISDQDGRIAPDPSTDRSPLSILPRRSPTLRIILLLLKSLLWLYGSLMLAALLSIPAGVALTPILGFAEAMSPTARENILQFVWLSMVAIVVSGIVIDWLERLGSADRSRTPKPPSPRRLQDRAPWLQAVSTAEDVAAPPALSPPRKSRP